MEAHWKKKGESRLSDVGDNLEDGSDSDNGMAKRERRSCTSISMVLLYSHSIQLVTRTKPYLGGGYAMGLVHLEAQ